MTAVIIVALPFLSRHDAVSNDARMQVKALKHAGYDARLFAELFEAGSEHESISMDDFRQLVADPANVLLFHMCVAWAPLDEVLARSHCKVILRYHNITPPSYFDAYDREGAHATREGLRQMARVVKSPRISTFVPTSRSTLADTVQEWGKVTCPTVTVAPFMALAKDEHRGDDEETARVLKDGRVHLLFVGRWAPNKGHRHLIAVINAYRELYGNDVCLTIAGKVSPNFRGYQASVLALAAELGVGDCLRVLGGVDQKALLTYYRYASAFLVLSEHEGFCVPVVEAQSLGLPVLAWEHTAVGDTVGAGQLTSPRLDYDFFAAAAHAVGRDATLRQTLATEGFANVRQFEEPVLARQTIDYVEATLKKAPS